MQNARIKSTRKQAPITHATLLFICITFIWGDTSN